MSAAATRSSKSGDVIRAARLRRRTLLLFVSAAVVLITFRSFDLQVRERAVWRAVAQGQQADQTALPAPRGTIYDRDGVPLAASDEAVRISLAPRELRDRKETVRLLQKHAGLTRRAAQEATNPARRWVVLSGQFDADVRRGLNGVRGVYLERVLRRFYPRGAIATELIGAVSADGGPLSGLELEFDSLLAGHPGRALQRRDANGAAIPGALHEFIPPVPGHDLHLTIDADLQEIAREALAGALERTGAASGEIVLSDPRTGEILAAVTSKPGMHAWRAATEPYEPGSTLKPFAVATLLAEDLARLDETVFAENGEYKSDGRIIRDVHPYGWLTIAEALKHSSNIALAKLSTRLDPVTQYTYLRAFGFGTPTAIAYPSESSGLLRRPPRWTKYSPASLAIGYEISVTPLQMLMAYGALANGGVLMEPRLVREVRSRDGGISAEYTPRAVRRVLPARVADELRAVLTDAVEAGTAREAALGSFAVAGKTGTARAFGAGHYRNGAYYSSFAGFFPAVEPQLVFLVKLDSPQGAYYGGATAAPVTRATLEAAVAALSTPLDKRVLATSAPPPLEAVAVPAASTPATGPFIFALDAGPVRSVREVADDAAHTPDVTGLPLRDAVRRLHAQGFRVRVRGTGVVSSMQPKSGIRLPKGALVRLQAVEVRP